MKKIFCSSTNFTGRVARSSAKSWDLRGGWMNYGLSSKETVLDFLFPPGHNYSSGRWNEENAKDEVQQESSKGSPKLNMYWNLDDNQRRKFVHPGYVRESVQDTFMQRAHGSYHYKRPTQFPVLNSVPQKVASAPAQKSPPAAGTNWNSKSKSLQPISKPHAPKKKKMIETAELAPNFIGKPTRALTRSKAGAKLKESGKQQLELTKKKLSNAQSTVLQYLVAKHSTKFSGYQMKPRKTKSDVKSNQPLVPQPVKRAKDTKNDKDEQDQIRITPRSIEVNSKLARSSKSLHKLLERKDHRGRKSKNKKSPEKSTITPPKTKSEEKHVSKSASRQDNRREAIRNHVNTAMAFHRQNRSIKRQVSNLDLTPQIYPRGSLSMKKSYLPINPCRQVTSNSSGGGYRNPVPLPTIMNNDPKPLIDSSCRSRSNESPTITGKLVNSLKALLEKIRDMGSK